MLRRNAPFYALFAAILALAGSIPAEAQKGRRGEQEELREKFNRGTIMSLRQIEAALVPAMKRRGADYIGAEFDNGMLRYRLKFVRQSSVIWIDVDGRSGQIIAQAGN